MPGHVLPHCESLQFHLPTGASTTSEVQGHEEEQSQGRPDGRADAACDTTKTLKCVLMIVLNTDNVRINSCDRNDVIDQRQQSLSDGPGVGYREVELSTLRREIQFNLNPVIPRRNTPKIWRYD